MRWIGKLLCWLGCHKPDIYNPVVEKRQKGKHKWHKNYIVCERCGKRLYSFTKGW